MKSPIRSISPADTWRGALAGLAGMLASLPAVVVAAIAPLAPLPQPVRVLGFALTLAAGVAAAGLIPATRGACVRFANYLLGTALPTPEPAARPQRARTAAWLLLNTGTGYLVTFAAIAVLFPAIAFPVIWLGGGGHMDYLQWSITVSTGPAGAWTLPAAAAHLAIAGLLAIATTALQRRTARALLGPTAAERLAALTAHADALAHHNELARDLHDSIGHTLTATTIQAAVAGQLMESDPDAARRALAAVESTSRVALTDLDHVLGVLRHEAPTGHDGRAPSLDELPELLERVAATAVAVHTDITARPNQVPAAVSREAYRIVQEGLTNVLRHAPNAPITIALTHDGELLHIDITNPIPGAATGPPRLGRGLTGIAERAALLGGTVNAGPIADASHGWRLSAVLPIASAA